MAQWIAYTHQGHAGFGTLTDDSVQVHTGDLFAQPQPTGEVLNLAVVHIGLPCDPSKFIGLWNNYHVQTAKQNLSIPAEPLYFIKAPSSYLAHKQKITSPATYDGRVVYENWVLSLAKLAKISVLKTQNAPSSATPAQIVSQLSMDMTLMPGDIIACGTSLGVLPMKTGTVVEVVIEGIGSLQNTFGHLEL